MCVTILYYTSHNLPDTDIKTYWMLTVRPSLKSILHIDITFATSYSSDTKTLLCAILWTETVVLLHTKC